jgi:aminoglycoside phosphotransferase (APT) family kinase protein
MTTDIRLALHLAARAPRYFADVSAESVEVRLQSRSVRAQSTLYYFGLTARHAHDVVVKLPSARHVDPARSGDPQPMAKSELEYETLADIHRVFTAINDPRFTAVKPLELMPQDGALVMEHAQGIGLNRLLAACHRGRMPSSAIRDVDLALSRAGAWLRAWHQMGALPHTRMRRTRRDDYQAFIAEHTRTLMAGGDRTMFERAREAATMAAAAALPPDLPLGTSHGDFAPRNVIVGQHGQVAVIDTLGRWKTPIYGDLGNFLFALRAARVQVLSMGWAFSATLIAQWERAFLHGYFDESPVPMAAIRLFELRALLDKWASVQRRRSPSTSLSRRWQVGAWSRFLTHYLRRLLGDIERECRCGACVVSNVSQTRVAT